MAPAGASAVGSVVGLRTRTKFSFGPWPQPGRDRSKHPWRTMIGFLERIAETIERHGMLAPGRRVGVAVSGGADSVCLLHVLLELAPRWDVLLSVLHLNHGLRGEESRQDAEFVGRLAALRGLAFHLREAELAGAPGNLEQAARQARLGFFRETIENGAVDSVALGHTRSDQAETVLFRFLRGSGTAGLAGIRPVTAQGIVRPLLEVDRAEVEQFLRERGIPWREDSTNASLRFARNRIRHGLLPQLAREWNPGIRETLVQTADWAGAEEAYWDAEIEKLAAGCLSESGGAVIARADSLASLPVAAARRLVRHAIRRVRGDLRRIDFRHVAAILELAGRREGHGRVAAPQLEVCRSFDWLRFARPEDRARGYSLPAPVPGTVEVPGTDLGISLELIEKAETSASDECVYNNDVGCLDWRALSGPLELRNWRPGDRYQPTGTGAQEKIKTLFERARIPLWERWHWPILVDGASIVWMRGFRPAAGLAATTNCSRILRVRVTGSRPAKSESGSGGTASNEVRAGREVS